MDSVPPTKSVENAFRPAFEEIQRRVDAANEVSGGLPETTYFEPSETPIQMPYVLPDQEYVLMSMGTAVTAPRPLDSSCPTSRIYGAFPTRDDALEHVEYVRERDPTCSLMIVRRGTWVLFPINEVCLQDSTKMEERVRLKLDAYATGRLREKTEFKNMIEKQIKRAEPKMIPFEEDDPAEEAANKEAERLVYKPPKRLRAGAEVRGQSAAAICVGADEFECLLCTWMF